MGSFLFLSLSSLLSTVSGCGGWKKGYFRVQWRGLLLSWKRKSLSMLMKVTVDGDKGCVVVVIVHYSLHVFSLFFFFHTFIFLNFPFTFFLNFVLSVHCSFSLLFILTLKALDLFYSITFHNLPFYSCIYPFIYFYYFYFWIVWRWGF